MQHYIHFINIPFFIMGAYNVTPFSFYKNNSTSHYAGFSLFAPGVPLTILCGYSEPAAPQLFVPGGYRKAVAPPVYGGSVATAPFCPAGSLTK